VFGEFWIALVFSLANAAILSWRIRAEDRALSPRRSLLVDGGGGYDR
jgi:isoprenylcysteine carboxyl methyltransferase (ICMT) family protein YpbQ